MTVEQLLQNTTSAELTEWVAYFQLEQEAEQAQDPEVSEVDVWRKVFNAYG
jgi:hypothetical protein